MNEEVKDEEIVNKKAFWFWFRQHPFFVAVIILLFMVVPGFIRVESVANDSRETALELEKDRKRESVQACITRNTFQQNSRNRFVDFNNALLIAFTQEGQSEERARQIERFVTQLRRAVEVDPTIEDRDCNKDGELDTLDYLP